MKKYEIINATFIWRETSFSSEDDYTEGRKYLSYSCSNCSNSIDFSINDLDKHRFLNFSNLSKKDKRKFDLISLSYLPYYFVSPKRQRNQLSKKQKVLICFQKLYLKLRFNKISQNFKLLNWPPDSFIDFYCPKCNYPVRISYSSYIGGKHNEHGYVLAYVIRKN